SDQDNNTSAATIMAAPINTIGLESTIIPTTIVVTAAASRHVNIVGIWRAIRTTPSYPPPSKPRQRKKNGPHDAARGEIRTVLDDYKTGYKLDSVILRPEIRRVRLTARRFLNHCLTITCINSRGDRS